MDEILKFQRPEELEFLRKRSIEGELNVKELQIINMYLELKLIFL